tara:strand:- start:15 stop:407 length:393 start_codon:yes stop_codon:yes gene_type:complete
MSQSFHPHPGDLVQIRGLHTDAYLNNTHAIIGVHDPEDPGTLTEGRIPVLLLERTYNNDGHLIDPATVQMVKRENIEFVDIPVVMPHQERCDRYIIAYEQQHGLLLGTLQLQTAAGMAHRTRISGLRNLA